MNVHIPDATVFHSAGFALFCMLMFAHILLNFPLRVNYLKIGQLPLRALDIWLIVYHTFVQTFAVYFITHNLAAVVISLIAYLLVDLLRVTNKIEALGEELIHTVVKVLLVVCLLF